VYQGVVDELNTVRLNRATGYLGVWHPVDSKSTDSLTDEQQQALQLAIDACIETLEAHVWAASEVIATAQLISCMRAKSWQLSVEELVVTE
jgi:hypothetical protein